MLEIIGEIVYCQRQYFLVALLLTGGERRLLMNIFEAIKSLFSKSKVAKQTEERISQKELTTPDFIDYDGMEIKAGFQSHQRKGANVCPGSSVG